MILRGAVASKTLAMETGITIITPDADLPGTPGCAYVLHGMYGNHESWATYTMLPVYARRYNTVFIMPEVARSFYADLRHGQKFFTYVADELPALVEKTFNIASDRENTTVIGGSMGGNGAIRIALRRPERFGRCCAFASAALFLRQYVESIGGAAGQRAAEETLGSQLVEDFRCILGDSFQVPPEFDIPALAQSLAPAAAKPAFYSACGVDDIQFREENAAFAKLMQTLGYDFTHEELPGDHHWPFFDSAVRRGLEFFFGSGE